MGMYDSINFTCPKCEGRVEVQSKAGDCALHEYAPDAVPIVIAKSIEGDVVWCESCDISFVAVITPPAPATVSMGLVRKSRWR